MSPREKERKGGRERDHSAHREKGGRWTQVKVRRKWWWCQRQRERERTMVGKSDVMRKKRENKKQWGQKEDDQKGGEEIGKSQKEKGWS